MDLLLVAATPMEIAPLLAWLNEHDRTFDKVNPVMGLPAFKIGQVSIEVLITGIGMTATAYRLSRCLQQKKYGLVLQAGIAGSYTELYPPGTLVQVVSETFADLGIEDHDQYFDLFETGLEEPSGFPFDKGELKPPESIFSLNVDMPRVKGVTVNTVSGCQPTIDRRKLKYRPDTESMEGAALHFVCLNEGVDFMQIRAISNFVTPRDRSTWKMKEAIQNLNNWLRDYLMNPEKK